MTINVTASAKIKFGASEVLIRSDSRPGNVVVLKKATIGDGMDWSVYYSDILIYDGFYSRVGRSDEDLSKQALDDAKFWLDGQMPIGFYQECTNEESCRESLSKYRFDRA